ncbi:MAG: ankyrin repeat protein [Chlamydiales bacterium]|jgi:ankyrin repeat protein
MKASISGKIQAMDFLLGQGADKDLQNFYGETALLCACESRQLEAARLLVMRGAVLEIPSSMKEGKYRSVMIRSISFQDLSWQELFLQNGADVNLQDEDGGTALGWAVHYRDMELVKFLLDNNADVNGRSTFGGDSTPLIQTARSSFWEDSSPQRFADDRRFARFLLDRGASIDYQLSESRHEGNTALIEAVSSKKIKLVHFLVSRNADVMIQNEEGESALTIAVKGGNLDLVQFLLSKGAEVSVMDRSGRNLLNILVSSYSAMNKKELALLLFDAGLDIDEEDQEGYTPLMRATQGYTLENLQFLIDLGADLQKRNSEGKTALLLAQENFKQDMERLLIDKGALFHSYEEEKVEPRMTL